MTKYINTETQEVSTKRAVIDSIKKTTSLGPNTLSELDWVAVLPAPRPEPSTNLKIVVGNGVTQDSLGNWIEAYIERDMFQDTQEDGVTTTKAEHEAAYFERLEDATAKAVRSTRGVLIAETDWTNGSDVVMTSEMTTYRQALRDVPQQDGFPNNITWPEL